MPCVYPRDAWYSQRTNESGKRGIVFNIKQGHSDRHLQVPCGKCIGCACDKALVWSIRMYHEAQQHEQNCFVTLTYAKAPSRIDKRHLQLFFKRLRKHTKLRYFACGEYGTKTHRPHYHVVLFGRDFLERSSAINDKLYTHPEILGAWGHGLVSIGAVSIASCMYVAGYATKKLGDTDTFTLMSRRPGIGHTWAEKYRDELQRTEKIVIDGRELPVPKRYIEWDPTYLHNITVSRRRYIQNLSEEQRSDRQAQHRHREINYRANLKRKEGTL